MSILPYINVSCSIEGLLSKKREKKKKRKRKSKKKENKLTNSIQRDMDVNAKVSTRLLFSHESLQTTKYPLTFRNQFGKLLVQVIKLVVPLADK